MRGLGVALLLMLSACTGSGRPAFREGQVWALKSDVAPDAKIVVGRIEDRQGKTVVHGAVVDLPAVPRAVEAIKEMDRQWPEKRPDDTDRAGVGVSGLSEPGDDLLGWTDTSILIDISPNAPLGPLSITEIHLYAADLRKSVTRLVPGARPLPAMWDTKLWTEGETEWRELNDATLARPLSKTMSIAINGSRAFLEPFLHPAPAAMPAADETAYSDPEFAAACHDWVKTVLDQSDEEIGDTLLTRSPSLGVIWRADRGPRGAPPTDSVDRASCWMSADSEGPQMAFGWSAPPLSTAAASFRATR